MCTMYGKLNNGRELLTGLYVTCQFLVIRERTYEMRGHLVRHVGVLLALDLAGLQGRQHLGDLALAQARLQHLILHPCHH